MGKKINEIKETLVRGRFYKEDNETNINKKVNIEFDKNKTSFLSGYLWLLTIIFIILKLTGNITFSWWWVFSPILIPIGLFLVLAILIEILRK